MDIQMIRTRWTEKQVRDNVNRSNQSNRISRFFFLGAVGSLCLVWISRLPIEGSFCPFVGERVGSL